MKTAIVIIALVLGAINATEMSLSIENQIQKLQKTGWGQVASAFIELQLKLGGPLDELETAFRSLFQDLQFQKDMEMQEWALKTNDHNVLAAQIAGRISSAQTDIAQATHNIDNVLVPLAEQLTTQIANDNTLIDTTTQDMANAVTERGNDHGAYEQNVEELENAIAALNECIQLVTSLRNEASLIQITKSQNHIKKLLKHFAHRTEWTEMVKVMLTLAQNFSDQSSVERVLGMLQDVLGECHNALAAAHQDEEDQVAAFTNFMGVCQQTLDQCNERIATNTAELNNTNDQITETTNFRAKREGDLADAQEDEAAETERWNNETAIHDRLVAELDDQLGAILEIVEIVGSAEVSSTTFERMNA